MIRKSFFQLFVLSVLAVSVAAFAQSEWVKLGEKDVDFGNDHDTYDVDKKGPIRELRVSVRYAPIKFQKVVINYKDGERREMQNLTDVQLGEESRTMNIQGDGHPIKSLDLYYETDSLGKKKAKVAVFGRP